MRRRHRRMLNVFSILLLVVALYLNLFRMNDSEKVVNKTVFTKSDRPGPINLTGANKSSSKELHKN